MGTLRNSGLIAAHACMLVACGGGGGSSGGDSGPSVPPPQRAPFIVLDGTNAISAAGRAVKLIEEATVAAQLAILAADLTLLFDLTETHIDCLDFSNGTTMRAAFTDTDSSGGPSAGDILTAAHDACGGVARTMSITISAISLTEGRLEGALEFEALRDDGSRSAGTFDLVSVFDAAADELTQALEDLLATASDTSLTGRADHLIGAAGGEYSLGFSGEVESAVLGGRYSFDTPEPFSGTSGEVPSQGSLIIAGLDSRLRIGPSADATISEAFFDYQIDPSGQSEFGPIENALWRDVVTGLLFSWDGNAAPRISSLSIAPARPTVLDDLLATYSAYDLEQEALTYRLNWWRDGIPLNPQTDILPVGLHHKGNTIRVSLEVSDGKESTTQWVSTTIVNAPPRVTASLSPTAPTTTSRLYLGYGASDPDGDPIADVVFEWQRNGVTLAEQTTQLLDASQHVRDDVITGVVRVSDGELAAMDQASVSILDTPVVISLAPPPPFIEVGGVLSLDASAVDADGDSVGRFELTHGPAGMMIDAVTGHITWAVNRPSFGDAPGVGNANVNFGVTSDAPGANVVTHILTVIDPTPEYPLMRTGIYPPLTEGIESGDFNNDGIDELAIVSDSAIYMLEHNGPGYLPSWSYPFAMRARTRYSALATYDIDGDGSAEIVAGESNSIFKFDGATRAYAGGMSISLPHGQVWRDIELADVNNDGRPNLVAISTLDRAADVASPSELVLINADSMSLVRVFNRNDYGSSVALGDVDGDAALEIVTGGGYVIDGATRAEEWRRTAGFGQEVAVGDLDGDGFEEIVGSAAVGSIDIFDFPTRSVRWSVSNPGIAVIRIADLNADGIDDLIVGDGAGGLGQISAWTYDAATDELVSMFTLPSGSADVTALALGDVDGDGERELVWGAAEQGGMITVAGTNPAVIEWTNLDEPVTNATGPFAGGRLIEAPAEAARLAFLSRTSGAGGPIGIGLDPLGVFADYGADVGIDADAAVMTTADFDNDGTTEMLIAVSSGAAHSQLAYDAFVANVEWASALTASSASVVAAVAQGDLTGDAQAELVVIDSDGVLRVYDLAADTLVWEGPMLLDGVDVALAELNGGGFPELVVAAGDRVHVYSRDGGSFAVISVSVGTYPDLRDVEVGDVDGDGLVDIFALYGTATSVVRLDAGLIEQGAFEHWRQSGSILIEASPYPRKNLILVESVSDPQIAAVDPESGTEVWSSPQLLGAIGRDSVHFVELPGETAARIAVATELGVLVTR